MDVSVDTLLQCVVVDARIYINIYCIIIRQLNLLENIYIRVLVNPHPHRLFY